MKVSVVIAAYNTVAYLERAIRSVTNQSLSQTQYEIIVVNDGSDDGSRSLLMEMTGQYQLRSLHLAGNYGVGTACNEGFKQARGQYVVRVDSDDWISEKMLEIESLFLDLNKDMDAVACDYLRVDDNENVLGRFNSDDDPIDCGVMYRKDRMGLYGQARVDDLRERFCEKHTISRIVLPLYRYRVRQGSLTSGITGSQTSKLLVGSQIHGIMKHLGY